MENINIENEESNAKINSESSELTFNLENVNKLCSNCKYSGVVWCKEYYSKLFQWDFLNWTSGNEFIDKFIQRAQLNTVKDIHFLEWILYIRLENIEYLDKRGFSVYNAIWLDGPIYGWDKYEKKWGRYGNRKVILKNLNESYLSDEFLKKVLYQLYHYFNFNNLFQINFFLYNL